MIHKPFPHISLTQRLVRLEPPTRKVSMVLDTDTYNEIDDQFALVYSLFSPDRLAVKAVYAAPFDNDRSRDPEDGMERSYREILAILDKLKRHNLVDRPPVFKGARRWFPTPGDAVESDAARHLIETVEQQPDDDPLYVVAIAAITNIASAILLKPDIIQKMVVVWLAGHPHTYFHTDEFNLRQDIHASRVILDCGVPLVLIPCFNVAEHLLLTREDVTNRLAGRGEIGSYLAGEYLKYVNARQQDSRSIWDMSPISWLINPEWVDTALIASPILTTSPLQGEQYDTPVLGLKTDLTKNRKEHCTWAIDPRRHLIREAYRLRRDAIFRDFFSKLDLQQQS